MFAIFCVAFYYGSHVVSDGFCNFADFMKALMVLIFGLFKRNHILIAGLNLYSIISHTEPLGAMFAGQVSSTGPDVQKAGEGAKRLYRIIKAHEVRWRFADEFI